MNDCTRLSCSIGVYVDGELDPGHAVDLEAHMIACSACAERVAARRAMRRSLQRTSALRCPSPLRARVGAMMASDRYQQDKQLTDGAPGSRLIRLRYAVGLAAAAGVLFAMNMARDVSSAPPSSGPGTFADVKRGFDILDDLVALHENPLPPELSNPEDLSRLDEVIGVSVRRPAFQPLGGSFEGARVHAIWNLRTAQLEYMFRGGHRVTVYVWNPRVVNVKTMPLRKRVVHERPVYVGNVRGYSIAAAEKDGIGCALASDLDPDQSSDLVLAALSQ